jgi:hypothetical protein
MTCHTISDEECSNSSKGHKNETEVSVHFLEEDSLVTVQHAS